MVGAARNFRDSGETRIIHPTMISVSFFTRSTVPGTSDRCQVAAARPQCGRAPGGGRIIPAAAAAAGRSAA
eukprot:392172-Hanusia_phi.AAC.1